MQDKIRLDLNCYRVVETTGGRLWKKIFFRITIRSHGRYPGFCHLIPWINHHRCGSMDSPTFCKATSTLKALAHKAHSLLRSTTQLETESRVPFYFPFWCCSTPSSWFDCWDWNTARVYEGLVFVTMLSHQTRGATDRTVLGLQLPTTTSSTKAEGFFFLVLLLFHIVYQRSIVELKVGLVFSFFSLSSGCFYRSKRVIERSVALKLSFKL